MSGPKRITIVGGGLAGLTLGIGLRRLDVPVTVWEARHYPRHRVCGEFISGRGQAVLEKMNLEPLLMNSGAVFAKHASFYSARKGSRPRPIDPPALCLSRFVLDQKLAEEFCRLGGELRDNSRWESVQDQPGVVFANGRRIQNIDHGWRWFGLKAHARGVELEADLEMHMGDDCYVGLCRLPDNLVNVCGLFRSRQGKRPFSTRELLQGTPGTRRHERLGEALFDETSFCSVAGLCLRPNAASSESECRLGDALTMIPPVTGNGMSMALEAAEMATGPLSAYARGEAGWEATREAIACACDGAFRTRLFWATWVQRFMFCRGSQTAFATWMLGSDALWRVLFLSTR